MSAARKSTILAQERMPSGFGDAVADFHGAGAAAGEEGERSVFG